MRGSTSGLLVFLSAVTVSRQGFEGYIADGTFADIQLVPHSVFLLISTEQEWICGSSVLTQTLLLTAAHCLHECRSYDKCKVVAYAGHENLEKVHRYS